MSTQQPEALRLAKTTPSLRGGDWGDRAAAELRRLHALNAELLDLLMGVLKCDRGMLGYLFLLGWQEDMIRAAIAKAEGREA